MSLVTSQNLDDNDDSDNDMIDGPNPGVFSTYSIAPLEYMELVVGDWWTNSFSISLLCDINQMLKLMKFNISKMKDILKEVI